MYNKCIKAQQNKYEKYKQESKHNKYKQNKTQRNTNMNSNTYTISTDQ